MYIHAHTNVRTTKGVTDSSCVCQDLSSKHGEVHQLKTEKSELVQSLEEKEETLVGMFATFNMRYLCMYTFGVFVYRVLLCSSIN